MKTGFTIVGILALAFVINHFITFLAISLTTLAIIFLLIGIAFIAGKDKKASIPLILVAVLIFAGVISMPRHDLFVKDAGALSRK